MKKFISMCFIGDCQTQLVLKREDWTPVEWAAFCKAFELENVDTISFSEYKLEAVKEEE